jgi:hypothetical protein
MAFIAYFSSMFTSHCNHEFTNIHACSELIHRPLNHPKSLTHNLGGRHRLELPALQRLRQEATIYFLSNRIPTAHRNTKNPRDLHSRRHGRRLRKGQRRRNMPTTHLRHNIHDLQRRRADRVVCACEVAVWSSATISPTMEPERSRTLCSREFLAL